MTKLEIRIAMDNGDLNIYKPANSIVVTSEGINVEHVEGQSLIPTDQAKEIVIKPMA